MNRVQDDSINEIVQKYDLDPSKIIDFSTSINPLGLSPRAKRKLAKEGWSAIVRYPDPRSSQLRRALSRFCGLEETQILPGAGAMQFIYLIPRIFKFRKALLVTPAFDEYEKAVDVAGQGCRVDFFAADEEDGFELNVEGLMLALTQGYDALYLCNPNSATGILTEKKDLLKILGQAERRGVWFILDEAFIDFSSEQSLVKETKSASRLLVLRSLASFFALPGLRAGYLVSNSEVVRELSEGREPLTVNALAQMGAAESIQDLSYVDRTKQWITRERENLAQGLRAIPGFIPYPSSANFLLVELHPTLRLTAGELREKLLPRGVLICDCSSFHHLGPFFFRVAIRSKRENQTLLKALRQIQSEIVKGG